MGHFTITYSYPENPMEAAYTGETYHDHQETFTGTEDEAYQQQCDLLHSEFCEIKEIEEATYGVTTNR